MASTNDRTLSDSHHRVLAVGSAISDEVIRQRGYRTVTDAAELRELGFAPSQCRPPGLLLPLWTPDGGNGRYVFRPDNPRVIEDRKSKLPDGTYKQRVIKYEQPQGEGIRLDCPPACRPRLGDPAAPLFITEGQKKADALASRGAVAVALLGVWNFKGRNEFGGVTLLADFDYIALKNRRVFIVFDSDAWTKQGVRQALERLTEHLKRKGAVVAAVYLPPTADGRKQGVDDFLAAHPDKGPQDLAALAQGPRPQPTAAQPEMELLALSPPRMSRPLSLIGGRAYAATWAWVRITMTEGYNRKGEVVRYDPPKVDVEQRMFIIRDDGVIFGGGGDRPLEQLEVGPVLPEMVQPDRRLSPAGLKAYRAGKRPDAAEVFGRVRDCVDRFIDFDHSLADQGTMSEMVACYIMATWFLDAFTVAGFLWPNGDRGSGKTQLLAIICELSYLGQLVLAGGSFAALRDMADYGATLAFDDAENLSDPRRTDPDKRTLLLAGNRRGNVVPLKEKDENGWRLRYVNTFCFRLFSAIQLPDSVLASRTIVVPLIRTPDRYRANADPLDYALWPHDRQGLVDDLWMLSLAHLPELTAYEAGVNKDAPLTGRNLEPWRALLATAAWLTDKGVDGLRERMGSLSLAYQKERPNVEMSDLTALVIRALGMIVGKMVMDERANSANSANSANLSKRQFITTQTITAAAQTLIEAHELDYDSAHVTTRRVGLVLKKMRLESSRPSRTAKRGWMVSLNDVVRWANSYGLEVKAITGISAQLPNILHDVVGAVGEVGAVGATEMKTNLAWTGVL